MTNEALARKTAIKTVGDRDLMNLEVATAYIFSALNKAVKEYQLLREPQYSPLYEVLESELIPDNIKDLIKTWHLKLRSQIGAVRGDLEVAYRRGVDVGKALKD